MGTPKVTDISEHIQRRQEARLTPIRAVNALHRSARGLEPYSDVPAVAEVLPYIYAAIAKVEGR